MDQNTVVPLCASLVLVSLTFIVTQAPETIGNFYISFWLNFFWKDKEDTPNI